MPARAPHLQTAGFIGLGAAQTAVSRKLPEPSRLANLRSKPRDAQTVARERREPRSLGPGREGKDIS